MILENIKFNRFKENPLDILRVFLALVFLSAGFYRIFCPSAAVLEFTHLQLPIPFSWLTMIFEVIAGIGLLVNKYTKIIYSLLVIFLMIALIWAFIINGPVLLLTAGKLFVFNPDPVSVFLHFVFLLMIIVLMINRK